MFTIDDVEMAVHPYVYFLRNRHRFLDGDVVFEATKTMNICWLAIMSYRVPSNKATANFNLVNEIRLLDEVREWCEDALQGKWMIRPPYIFMESDEDAAWTRLQWVNST